jgi:hypothetical protein
MEHFHDSKAAPVPDDGPVIICTYAELIEAELAQSVLQQAGIKCFLYDENAYGFGGNRYNNVLGGMRLVVAAADAEGAKALLSQSGEGQGAPLR